MSKLSTEQAGWFKVEGRSLFGWVHAPQGRRPLGGVVLCYPILFERFSAQETIRRTAVVLAERGFVVLRFDYAATGDSSGRPEDLGDFWTWCEDIRAAVNLLKSAGLIWTAVVGMRLGAELVAAASSDLADATVLWDPVWSGRQFVRRSRLLQEMVLGERPSRPPAPSEAEPGGLPIPFGKRFVSSLTGLTLAEHEPAGHVLLLSRDGTVPPEFGGWTDLEVRAATGQAAFLERELDKGVVPSDTITLVSEWLVGRAPDRPAEVVDASDLLGTSTPVSPGVYEQVLRLGAQGELFGIATGERQEQSAKDEPVCLYFNSGAQYHIGPYRLWVDLSRSMAVEGIRSVRFDFSGIGDSDERPAFGRGDIFSPGVFQDIAEVVHQYQNSRLIIVGLSSGGYHALEAAVKHEILGVVSIHAGVNYWALQQRDETPDFERTVFVPDRRWLRRLVRTSVGMAVAWRVPSSVWRVLDFFRLQPDQGRGLDALGERTTQVVILLETSELTRPRAWRLLSRTLPSNITVMASRATDHALFSVADRATVGDVVKDAIRSFLERCRTEDAP